MSLDYIQGFLSSTFKFTLVFVDDSVPSTDIINFLLTALLGTVKVIAATNIAIFFPFVPAISASPVLVNIQANATCLTKTIIKIAVISTESLAWIAAFIALLLAGKCENCLIALALAITLW